MPSTLQLQSSSTLGSGRTHTAQEKLEKTEDKEVLRAIHSRQISGRFAGDTSESDEGEEVLDNTQDVHSKYDTTQDGEGTSPRGPVVIVDSTSTATRRQDVPDDAVVGSALQRNTDGSIVKPRIMKKKRGTTVRMISPLSCGVILISAVSRPFCEGGNVSRSQHYQPAQIVTLSLRSTAQILRMIPRKLSRRQRTPTRANDLRTAIQSRSRVSLGMNLLGIQVLHGGVWGSNSGL